jgi:hypothetical protein
MSPLKSLRSQTSRVILNRGDIIIDLITGFAGTLLTRERHIDPIDDDVFLWEVQWFNVSKNQMTDPPLIRHIEEEGLKLSIVVGTYEWHSIDGGTYEL